MNKWLRSYLAILVMTAWPLAPSWAEPLDAGMQDVAFGANESPPFWSSDMDGGGMCGLIVQAISKEAGLNSFINFRPLSRLIEDDSGNDLGNPIFFMANQDYSAIIPIAMYQSALFYYTPNHDEAISFTGLEDLKKYRVGILKGTLLDRSYFTQQGVIFAESYSQESLFKKLKLGRIDLVLEIDLIGHHMINSLYPEGKDDFGVIQLPRSSSPIAMMLDENMPPVYAVKYREALARIIDDGTYQEILERHYDPDNIPADWQIQLERFRRLYDFGGG